jgi:hypothetical protein
METDQDMTCPMAIDPLDIVEAIDALLGIDKALSHSSETSKAQERQIEELRSFSEEWAVKAYKAGYDEGAVDALHAQAIPHNDLRGEGCGDFMSEYYTASKALGDTLLDGGGK